MGYTPWLHRWLGWITRRPPCPELFEAASRNDVPAIEKLLAQNPRWARGRDWSRQGQTALMLAASEGHVDSVQALLSMSNTRDRDFGGGTVLHHTIGRGHPAVLYTLLPLCDTDQADHDGNTPLLIAARRHDEHFLLATLPLSDPHLRDREGNTALMWAAKATNASGVHVLLSAMCDPKARNRRGWSALIVAAHADSLLCVRMLLPHSDLSARVSKGRFCGYSALELAVCEGSPEVVRVLAQQTPSCEALEAAVHLIVGKKKTENIEVLLEFIPASRLSPLLDLILQQDPLAVPARALARAEREAIERSVRPTHRSPQRDAQPHAALVGVPVTPGPGESEANGPLGAPPCGSSATESVSGAPRPPLARKARRL